MGHAIMNIAMSNDIHMNVRPEAFIGSMKGTMEIVGDVVAPIDAKWDADAKAPGDPLEGSTDR
jgi:hypothetical protein